MPGTGTEQGKPRPLRATKAAQERVSTMLALQSEALEHLSQSELVAVDGVLRAAKAETATAVGGWVKQWPTDWSQRFDVQQARNALAMGRQVTGRLRQLGIGSTIQDSLEDQALEAAGMSLRNLNRELAVFGEIFDGSVHPISIGPAGIVAEGTKNLIPKYRTSAARYEGQVLQDLRQQISIGLARNETFDQMATRLARSGGPRGVVALRGVRGEPGAVTEVISEGLFQRHRYFAERLVRTEGIHVYNEIHQRGLTRQALEEREADEADGLEPDLDDRLMKKWDAAADRRLCPLCRSLDGQVAEPDGLFLGLYLHPGAHPNCRCTIVPWRLRWGKATGHVEVLDLSTLAHRDTKPAKKPEKEAKPEIKKAKLTELQLEALQTGIGASRDGVGVIEIPNRAGSGWAKVQTSLTERGFATVEKGTDRLIITDKGREQLAARGHRIPTIEEQTKLHQEARAKHEAERAQRIADERSAAAAKQAAAAEKARIAAEQAAEQARKDEEARAKVRAAAEAKKAEREREEAEALARRVAQDAAFKAQRERAAGAVAPNPELVAGVKAGDEQGFSRARDAMVADMTAQGMHYNRLISDHPVLINDEPTKVNAGAFNGWNGTTVFSPNTAKHANEFARMWSADEQATRAAIANIRPRDVERTKKIATLLAEHDAVDEKFFSWSPKKRKQAVLDFEQGRDTPGAANRSRADALYKQIVPLRDAANEEHKIRHAQAPIRDAINGMRTVIHEEFHSFGPVGTTTSWMYTGPGAVAEEVTTEILARRELATKFGVDRAALRNPASGVGSYNGIITGTHDAIMKETGLGHDAAWDRLEAASARYKTHKPSDGNPDPHQILAQELAGGDPILEKRLSARFSTLRIGKDD